MRATRLPWGARLTRWAVVALVAGAALAVTGGALAKGPAKAKTPVRTIATSQTVPGGVRVAGIRVGGLATSAAASAVKAAFAKPLPVVVDGKQVMLHPARLATAYVQPAIGKARFSKPGTNVRLVVNVHGAAVRSAVASLARRFDHHSRNAALRLVGGRPVVSQQVTGTTIDESALLLKVVRSLTGNVRRPLAVTARRVNPAVTAQSLGPMILIDREHNRLTLYHPDNTVWKTFPVATGQSIYPTPQGRFNIVVKWVDPWWYPPTQDSWAAGLKPVPPGPGNPLGTRWMGLSSPGIGIHGTDEPGSIGYSASHGCIRMQVADSEWLFTKVRVGTTVFII